MPLSRALLDVLLTYPCPHCRHKLRKKGSWFQTMGSYQCGSCRREIRLTYDGKIELFDAHVRLVKKSG